MRITTTILLVLFWVTSFSQIQTEKMWRKNNTDSIFKITILAGDTTWVFCYVNQITIALTGSAAAPGIVGSMTIPMTSSVITVTPAGNCTFNATGGVTGQMVTFIITTSGTTSFTLTFGTNFRKVGTLATGTVAARFFAVTFRCINGTIWQEISRTAAQT